MTFSPLKISLPLLTKDLIEQSSRPRTYWLRILYAVVLYGSALWIYGDVAGAGSSAGVSTLGHGRELFVALIGVQLAAVVILLPALSCGAITTEKEKDTLGLLLLTQLSPTTIVLEKLMSRVVTMGTYQMLSLPLFAVIYGLGGVELIEIFVSVWYLAWWTILIGALSIACSAWHRTTAGAFVSAYALMPIVVCFSGTCLSGMHTGMQDVWRQTESLSWVQFFFLLIGTLIFLAITAIPIAIAIGIVLTFAQIQMVERAFVPPRNLLLEMFKKLDRFFEELNKRTTRGVVLVRDLDTGPMFDPIAWRETRKRSLGTVRYLFRFLVLLETPLALAIGWTATDASAHSFNGPTMFFLTLLWPIAIIAVAVHTTNVLAAERSRQTIDVLLATPLSNRELVFQKLAGVRRLIGVLCVPFSTLIIFQSVWSLYVVNGLSTFVQESREGLVLLHEILGMTAAMIIYPRLIQWISFHLALRLKNQTQAVLSAITVIIALCLFPFAAVYLLAYFSYVDPASSSLNWITWLSPIRPLYHRVLLETANHGPWFGNPGNRHVLEDPLFIGFGIHVAVYLAIWIYLRGRAVKDFSQTLGRGEPAADHENVSLGAASVPSAS